MNREKARAEIANLKNIVEQAVDQGEISSSSMYALEFSFNLLHDFINDKKTTECAKEVKKIERLMLVLTHDEGLSYSKYDQSRTHLERLMSTIEQ